MYTPKFTSPPVLTVSQIDNYIRSVVQSDPRLMNVIVTGEITDMKSPFSGAKHNYFMLKDSGAVISAAMFIGDARRVVFRPENGLKVICRGRIDFYPPSGRLQLIIEDMQPDGIGALSLAFEQMKKRLEAEGLFEKEHKKPIPKFPRTVGVITSPTGAAVRDIIHNLYKRFPCVDMILYPTLVQGDAAPAQLVRAVQELDASGLCDTIIIGRGGGSIEELWAFNDEKLARAVYNCNTPIISAVQAKHLTEIRRMMDALSPQKSFDRYDGKLRLLEHRMQNAVDKKLSKGEHAVKSAAVKLESLNPIAVLAHGYSIVESDGKLIKSKEQIGKGDKLTLTFSDGKTTAVATGE